MSRGRYDAARERWDHTRLLVQAWTGQSLDEYPAYPESDDDYDPAEIERALMAHPLLRHAPTPVPAATED